MKDFHELVTEAGRHKALRKGASKIRQKHRNSDYESAPERESMRTRGGIRASFSLGDRLPPIKRWLWKQVGRPWNKVWSEISKLDFRSMSGNHIRDHINWWVERYPYWDGKVPCHPENRIWHRKENGTYSPIPLGPSYLYVDKQGILRKPKKQKTKPFVQDKFRLEIKGKPYRFVTENGMFEKADSLPNVPRVAIDRGGNLYTYYDYPKPTKFLVAKLGEPYRLVTIKEGREGAILWGDWPEVTVVGGRPHVPNEYGWSVVEGPFRAVYEEA